MPKDLDLNGIILYYTAEWVMWYCVDFGILTGCLIRCALFMRKLILSSYAAEFLVEVYGY